MRLPALASALILVCLNPALAGDEPQLRPSARLLFKYPQLLQNGQCVRYQEGGHGWVLPEPLYYLKGEVIAATIETRTIKVCPASTGKPLRQYTREEFNQLLQAQPCRLPQDDDRPRQIGLVKIRVADWETPHERKAATAGRLWRGMFINQPLRKGLEIELEADLLGPCLTDD